MSVSDKQRQANIRNAQLSTGPKTDAGKYRSRRNAIKHGLSGSDACLADIARAEVQAEMAAFERDLAPRDAVEWRYVEQAAFASVRHNRARAQAEALSERRCNSAIRDWDERRRAEVDGALARLRDAPAASVSVLARTAEGCDALCDDWAELKQVLREQGTWGPAHRARALALLGQCSTPQADAPARVLAFMRAALVIGGPLNQPWHMGYFRPSMDDVPEPGEAVALVLATADEEIARWSARGEQRWELYDAPARAEAVKAALAETEGEAQKLARYQSQAAREMRQAINGLMSYRRQKRLDEKAAGPPPEDSGRQNEPISPALIVAQEAQDQEVKVNSSPHPATAPAAPDRPSAPPMAAPSPVGALPDSPTGAEMDRPIPIG